MSKTRKAIIEFAHAHVYWYLHQSDWHAVTKANRLEKRAKKLINDFGTPEDQTALLQAFWRTLYLVPTR